MIQNNTQAPRVVLVTGSARRIGAHIAKFFHQQGGRVVIHANTHLNEAEALADQLNHTIPNTAYVIKADLTQQAACEALIGSTLDWGGRLDALVNNASCFKATDIAQFNEADWDSLFDIHVKAPFLLSTAAFPSLKDSAGSIVNVTDIYAEKPLKGYAAYSQSKAALAMQTKALACDFAPHVRVNAVSPGACLWPEGDNTLSAADKQRVIEKSLLKRLADPDSIAHAVYALVENPCITGEILHVGGRK